MADYLIYLIPLALLGVVVALIRGLSSFAQEGKEARMRSNRMMQWRLWLQALAMLLLFTALFIYGR